MTPEWSHRAGLMLESVYWKQNDDVETEDELEKFKRLLEDEYNPVKDAVQDSDSYDDLEDDMRAIFDRAEKAQKDYDEFIKNDVEGMGRFHEVWQFPPPASS